MQNLPGPSGPAVTGSTPVAASGSTGCTPFGSRCWESVACKRPKRSADAGWGPCGATTGISGGTRLTGTVSPLFSATDPEMYTEAAVAVVVGSMEGTSSRNRSDCPTWVTATGVTTPFNVTSLVRSTLAICAAGISVVPVSY